MKIRSSKNKGYRGEVEVIGMLNVILREEYAKLPGVPPPELVRSPHGRDIRGLPWLAPEVKYHEPTGALDQFTPSKIAGWWHQCKVNTPAGAESVLFYRGNHMPWRVRMFGELPLTGSAVRTPVDIPIEPFLVWFRNRVKEKLPTRTS